VSKKRDRHNFNNPNNNFEESEADKRMTAEYERRCAWRDNLTAITAIIVTLVIACTYTFPRLIAGARTLVGVGEQELYVIVGVPLLACLVLMLAGRAFFSFLLKIPIW
jgi:hypothetical protein